MGFGVSLEEVQEEQGSPCVRPDGASLHRGAGAGPEGRGGRGVGQGVVEKSLAPAGCWGQPRREGRGPAIPSQDLAEAAGTPRS